MFAAEVTAAEISAEKSIKLLCTPVKTASKFAASAVTPSTSGEIPTEKELVSNALALGLVLGSPLSFSSFINL